MTRSRRAVFLDRDGVLIRDVHLLTRCDEVELFPQAPEAVDRLVASGFAVVVVSNQAVVARGLATEEDVEEVNECIQRQLRTAGSGQVERFYSCPHHPNADVPRYRIVCECRKPRPGLFLRAAADLQLDLNRSFAVGDRITDIIAGNRAGCRTILMETGAHTAPPIESVDELDLVVQPDHICGNLSQAADIILANGK